MKVTYNWLKDFVNIMIPAEVLADKLTMAGLEVKSIEPQEGDFVFEIEITSNRPDWLSVIGVAREVAAVTGKRLKPLVMNRLAKDKNKHPINISVEDKKDCPVYTAKVINQVKVGPSPDWLQQRLRLIGCRSVNNIVDITNYAMFTFGQPLHAFDLDKLNTDLIVVRRARPQEKILTIDGKDSILSADKLVIADRNRPVAIAGIIGGKDTEVDQKTKSILLESASFNPLLIRRTRQNLNIQTESSYRFERGTNITTVIAASAFAEELIQDIAGGVIVSHKHTNMPIKTKQIFLDCQDINETLGTNVKEENARNILLSLGFDVKNKAQKKLAVTVPDFRQDVKTGIDLIEEIARIHGYENIPVSLPAVMPQPARKTFRDFVFDLKNLLVGLGLNEAITYSLVDKELLKQAGVSCDMPIEIENPLSQDQEILRPTLIPSLLKCVKRNLNQQQDYINLFEAASVFLKTNDSLKEEFSLGIILCGTRTFLLNQGLVKDESGPLHLKGILEECFLRIGIKDYDFLQRGPTDIRVTVGGDEVGCLKILDNIVLEQFDIKNHSCFAAELSLEKIFAKAVFKKQFVPLPKYPAISRDISFAIKEDVSASQVLDAIRDNPLPLLQEVRITDYYKGQQISKGFKSLTLCCVYRSHERTLTESEVTPIHSKLSDTIVKVLGAQVR